MTDTPRKDGPRTEAGRRLLAKLDDIGRSPLSGVSFPDAEDDIARIEAEAAAGPKPAPSTTPQARDDGLREAIDAIADALNAWDMGESPRPDTHRHWSRIVEALTPADNDGALPSRVVVGANGAYWRDYGTHYSMCPVSTDNDPVEPVAIYVRAKWSEAIRAEEAAALAATTGAAPSESEERS